MTDDFPSELEFEGVAGQRLKLRTMVRGAYNVQEFRIRVGNRLIQIFRKRLGQRPGQPESELDEERREVLDVLRAAYRRLADGVAEGKLPGRSRFVGDHVIRDYLEMTLVHQHMELVRIEAAMFRQLVGALDQFPIWSTYLRDVRGCGPTMSAVLIGEIDITRALYPSSLWKYCGLDVAPDGAGRSRKKPHLVDRDYVTSDGEAKTRKSITFNPFLKTRLIGVLAPSFLRSASPYRSAYDGYKHRLETDPARAEWTKGHRHLAAMRYMVKTFLVDLHVNWRRMEGLPVSEPYSVAKLGLRAHGGE